MSVSSLEAANRNNVYVAIKQCTQIELKMNLVENRGARTELDQEVNVRALAILAARDRAKYLDVEGMPSSQETLDVLGVRQHGVANCAHAHILRQQDQGDSDLHRPVKVRLSWPLVWSRHIRFQRLCGRRERGAEGLAAAACFVMVGWDVAMDPASSSVYGEWIWTKGGTRRDESRRVVIGVPQLTKSVEPGGLRSNAGRGIEYRDDRFRWGHVLPGAVDRGVPVRCKEGLYDIVRRVVAKTGSAPWTHRRA